MIIIRYHYLVSFFFSVKNLDYSEHIIEKNSTVHLNGPNEEKQSKIKIMQQQNPIKTSNDYIAGNGSF